MPDESFNKVDGYFERQSDPEFNAINPQCFNRDGAHFCSAVHTFVASQGGMVILSMEAGSAGLFISLTPAGVRRFANDLLGVADKVEADHAETANAQLAATLAKKAQ